MNHQRNDFPLDDIVVVEDRKRPLPPGMFVVVFEDTVKGRGEDRVTWARKMLKEALRKYGFRATDIRGL